MVAENRGLAHIAIESRLLKAAAVPAGGVML
jgi:hypothetical protein